MKVDPADNFSTAGRYYQALALKKMGKECNSAYEVEGIEGQLDGAANAIEDADQQVADAFKVQ